MRLRRTDNDSTPDLARLRLGSLDRAIDFLDLRRCEPERGERLAQIPRHGTTRTIQIASRTRRRQLTQLHSKFVRLYVCMYGL